MPLLLVLFQYGFDSGTTRFDTEKSSQGLVPHPYRHAFALCGDRVGTMLVATTSHHRHLRMQRNMIHHLMPGAGCSVLPYINPAVILMLISIAGAECVNAPTEI